MRSGIFLLSAGLAAAGDDTYFMQPPTGKSGPEIALVLIQGAKCPPAAYKSLAGAIQNTSSFPIWIGVPEYISDTPEPAQFGSKVNDVLQRMEKAGMAANHTVIAAHSLGGWRLRPRVWWLRPRRQLGGGR